MSLSFDDAFSIYQHLPQSQHIPKDRFVNWYKQLQIKGEKVDFHLRRAQCVGGSEVGAIIEWYFKDVSTLPISDGFKSALEIAREKLLIDLPYSTQYTRRGIGIEPFIRRVCEIKNNIQEDQRDVESLETIRIHKNNRFMGANPDDIFIFKKSGETKRILFDYKSSVEEYPEAPFRQIAQLNHYDEVGRSEGFHFDAAFILGLHTSEKMFEDLIRFTEQRKENPERFEKWAKIVASEELEGIKLKLYPVKLDPQMGKLCSQVSKRFMEDFPLQGKFPGVNHTETVLNDSEVEIAKNIEGHVFHLSAMKKSVENLETALKKKAQDFAEEIGQFSWPSEFPIRCKVKETMDTASAIAFLRGQGFTEGDYSVKDDKLDQNKLLAKIESLGGVITTDDYSNKISKEKITALLNQIGVDSKAFIKNTEVSFELSRSSKDVDFIQSTQIQIQEELLKLSESMTQNEILQQTSELQMG